MHSDEKGGMLSHFLAALAYRTQSGGRYRPEPFETLEKEVARFHAMLRRLHGAPVPSENFAFADISPSNVGEEQPAPRRPDTDWREGL